MQVISSLRVPPNACISTFKLQNMNIFEEIIRFTFHVLLFIIENCSSWIVISKKELPKTRVFEDSDPNFYQFVQFNKLKIEELDEKIKIISGQITEDFARKCSI